MKITTADVRELRDRIDALLDEFTDFEGTWKQGAPFLHALSRASYYVNRCRIEAAKLTEPAAAPINAGMRQIAKQPHRRDGDAACKAESAREDV